MKKKLCTLIYHFSTANLIMVKLSRPNKEEDEDHNVSVEDVLFFFQ